MTGNPDASTCIDRPVKSLRTALLPGLLGTIAFAAPAGASAQDTVAADPSGGWIGIVTDTARLYTGGSGEPTFVIRVAAVHVRGPADLSGVLPGDILLAWDGRPLDSYNYPAWLSAVTDLDPGQQVVLRLLRDWVQREVTVVASDMPTEEYEVRIDMTGFDALPRWSDSVLAELQADSERFFDQMFDQMSGRIRSGAERRADVAWPDEALERSLTRRADGVVFPVPRLLGSFGPMGSVVLGGAQVWTLSGELGRYFGVEQGVLVLDAISMSPARRAGFRPGDAIVAVAGDEVATLSQLRALLARAVLPVQVTVVRKGERVVLTYPTR